MRNGFGLVAGALCVLGASEAQGAFVLVQVAGDFVVTLETPLFIDYGVQGSVTNQIGGMGFATAEGTARQTFMPVGTPDDFDIMFKLIGPTAADTMTISGMGFLTGQVGQTHGSWAGTCQIVGTTGVFAGLTGSGDFSGSSFFTSATAGSFFSTIQLDVVPSPSSVAVIGLGGLLAARRRRCR